MLQPAFNRLYQTLYNFQMENQRHNWIFWTIAGCGFLHVICLYSFYIYFLRMGHTWTKLLLHLNNMSMALVLPGGLGFTWVVGYIIGTRLVKHFCVVASMKSSLLRLIYENQLQSLYSDRAGGRHRHHRAAHGDCAAVDFWKPRPGQQCAEPG